MGSRTRPTDPTARERLRRAQAAEELAVRSIEAAHVRLERSRRRMETAVEAARLSVEQAAGALYDAKLALVRTSGVERAALLLDEPRSALRALARHRHRANTEQDDVALGGHVSARQTPAATAAPTSPPATTSPTL